DPDGRGRRVRARGDNGQPSGRNAARQDRVLVGASRGQDEGQLERGAGGDARRPVAGDREDMRPAARVADTEDGPTDWNDSGNELRRRVGDRDGDRMRRSASGRGCRRKPTDQEAGGGAKDRQAAHAVHDRKEDSRRVTAVALSVPSPELRRAENRCPPWATTRTHAGIQAAEGRLRRFSRVEASLP